MYLYINTFTQPQCIGVFREDGIMQDILLSEGKQKEYDTLIENIDVLLEKNNILYQDISWIICINWPWGFTWTRITTLIANTISYSKDTPLFPFTIYEYLRILHAPLPYIMMMTKRECLIWDSHNSWPKITENTSLQPGKYSTIEIWDFSGDREIQSYNWKQDHINFIKNISLNSPKKLIQPLYFRDPNITILTH